MGRGGAGAVAAALTLWWLTGRAGAVWLELATTAGKCLSEEIQSNIVVMADYSILFEEHPVRPTVFVKVQHVIENPSSSDCKRERGANVYHEADIVVIVIV